MSSPAAGADALPRELRAPDDHHAHVSVCIGPDGRVDLYPDGEPERIAEALRMLVRIFHEHPERIDCAAGACAGRCQHRA